jgi:putative transcriptional regulator
MSANQSLHYTQCGLDNVFLLNGFEWTSLQGGEEALRIEDIEGLHKAIAKAIVDSPEPLDAQTFLDMAQRQVGVMLELTEDAVSLWERAKSPIPRSADIVLRAMAQEHCNGNTRVSALIERFNQLDREVHEHTIQLCTREGHWQEAA